MILLVLLLTGCADSGCLDLPWLMRSGDFRGAFVHAIERSDGTLTDPEEILWATGERTAVAYPPAGGSARVGFTVDSWASGVEDETCTSGIAWADASELPAVERPYAVVDFSVDIIGVAAVDLLGPVEPTSPLIDLGAGATPLVDMERGEAGELVRLEVTSTYASLTERDRAIVRHVFTRLE